MKRTLLGTAVLGALLVGGAFSAGQDHAIIGEANAEPTKDIGGANAVGLLRLAVPAGDEVGNVIRSDARLSAGFEVIDRRSIPVALIKEQGLNVNGWNQVGAQAVIKNAEVGGQIRFQLYDLTRGASPVLSKGYPKGKPREAAHRFMNDVIKHFTGEPGVFGSRIAFVRTRRSPSVSKNVFTMEMDGGAVSSITSNRSLNILPSLGPGGQVLFTSYAKRNPDLWMSAGGAPKRISRFPGLNLGGTMSPSGSSIALTLSKDGNSEIYKISTSGSIQARLTQSAAIDGSPTWNANGSQIAFVSNRNGGPQIYRMTSGGGGAARVSKQGSYNQSPDWSPGTGERGNWIAYSGRSGGSFDIFKVNVQTGKVARLTQGSGRNLDPTWAPDGRLIAYSSSRGGITIANEEGMNQIEVMRAGTTPDWGPRAY